MNSFANRPWQTAELFQIHHTGLYTLIPFSSHVVLDRLPGRIQSEAKRTSGFQIADMPRSQVQEFHVESLKFDRYPPPLYCTTTA